MTAPLLEPEAIAGLVTRVTQMMLGVSFDVAPSQTIDPELCGRTALLEVAGQRGVLIGLSTSDHGCARIGAALFSCPVSDVDDGMKGDALGEILNMTAGQIRSALRIDEALGLPKSAGPGRVLTMAAWRPVRLAAPELELLVWLTETRTLERGGAR